MPADERERGGALALLWRDIQQRQAAIEAYHGLKMATGHMMKFYKWLHDGLEEPVSSHVLRVYGARAQAIHDQAQFTSPEEQIAVLFLLTSQLWTLFKEAIAEGITEERGPEAGGS